MIDGILRHIPLVISSLVEDEYGRSVIFLAVEEKRGLG